MKAALTDTIISLVVKNASDTRAADVRNSIGSAAGAVGIAANMLLFLAKLSVGLLTGSMAVTADAFNNLSDASSSAVSLAGFRLASKAPDDDHPFGHARYEYLAGLAVAAMVAAVGISLGWSSLQKVFDPAPMDLSIVSLSILAASIALKAWLASFNAAVGRRIDSGALLAAAADCKCDTIATAAVLLSMILCELTGITWLDGISGLAVSAFIVWNGFILIRETLSPLLGERPSPELVDMVKNTVMARPEVLGIHDLIVHDYGPGHRFASLHIELPVEDDPLTSHDLIENLEEEFRPLGLEVVIHYDPVVTNDPRIKELREALVKETQKIGRGLSVHDIRLIPGKATDIMLFDLAIPPSEFSNSDSFKHQLEDFARALNPRIRPVIKTELNYAHCTSE